MENIIVTQIKSVRIFQRFKVVGPADTCKENGHSVDDDSETKNGKKNGNGNGHSNGNGNGGTVSEDLRDWFGSGPKGGKGGGGWDRYNTKVKELVNVLEVRVGKQNACLLKGRPCLKQKGQLL